MTFKIEIWTQAMEMKQDQTFFYGADSNLTSQPFYQKILMYFSDFQNQNVSVLWLKSTETMEKKKNQAFFHGTC